MDKKSEDQMENIINISQDSDSSPPSETPRHQHQNSQAEAPARLNLCWPCGGRRL